MQTLVLTEPEHLILTEAPKPGAPPPGYALVRVHRVGVCGTDLHAFRGNQTFFTYPRILGHELGVEVVSINPAPESPAPGTALQVAVGERCAFEAYLSCGHCIACRQGKTNCCTALQYYGVHIDGGMRPYLTVPIAKLHPAAHLSFDQLALVETLTIGAHAVSRPQLTPGEFVLVIGAGPIGLTVIQFAQTAGARIIAMDIDAYRLAFCREHLHVEFAVPAGPAAFATVQEITGGDLPTAVFDATGNPASMNSSLPFVAHGGRLVFVGHHPGAVTFPDPEFHRRELTLYASRNSTAADYQTVINLITAGKIDTGAWITHRAPFDEVITQFPRWLLPESHVIKAMITV
ncbi:MAG: zinc-binding alcohol dehydrogenase family protein [Chloroflexi bacterium]|nr:zinc-binding alcohol dehydrogenase family protein [Chloroflexota bacterium]